MAGQQQNPFASLITPDRLENERDAAFDAYYADQDPWVRMAAKAGHEIAKYNRTKGIGLEAEDIKARNNEYVLSGAQKRYAELVKDGKMSADEAQALVLQDAISGFAAAGSWEQALALTQPYNELIQQKLERDKLKAEIKWAEERPDVEAAKAEAAVTRAEAAVQNAQTNEERARYIAELNAARAALAEAQAAWYSRRPGDTGGDKDGKGSVFEQRQAVELEETIRGFAGAARLMTQIRQIGISDPGALTGAGPLSTQIATIASSSKAFLAGKGYNPMTTKEGDEVGAIITRNVNDSKLQSVATDLAFAFARARDPGGRLSNQDVEMAAKIVTGAGSPQARLATLDMVFDNMDRQARELKTGKAGLGYEVPAETWAMFEDATGGYKATRQPKSKKAVGAAPPLSMLKPDGSPTTFKNGQVWKNDNGKAVRVK